MLMYGILRHFPYVVRFITAVRAPPYAFILNALADTFHIRWRATKNGSAGHL